MVGTMLIGYQQLYKRAKESRKLIVFPPYGINTVRRSLCSHGSGFLLPVGEKGKLGDSSITAKFEPDTIAYGRYAGRPLYVAQLYTRLTFSPSTWSRAGSGIFVVRLSSSLM